MASNILHMYLMIEEELNETIFLTFSFTARGLYKYKGQNTLYIHDAVNNV